MKDDQDRSSGDFARAAEESQRGFVGEVWDFVRHNKRWWLIPILIVLLLVAGLIFLGSTGAGPLIYPLF